MEPGTYNKRDMIKFFVALVGATTLAAVFPSLVDSTFADKDKSLEAIDRFDDKKVKENVSSIEYTGQDKDLIERIFQKYGIVVYSPEVDQYNSELLNTKWDSVSLIILEQALLQAPESYLKFGTKPEKIILLKYDTPEMEGLVSGWYDDKILTLFVPESFSYKQRSC